MSRRPSQNAPNDTLGLRDFLPGLLSMPSRLPGIIGSGLSIAFLFDDLPLSAGVILERNARNFGDRPALLFEDVRYTYGELNSIANQYARSFRSAGIKRGQVVIVFLENRPEMVIITAALAKLGAIASLVNPQQRGPVLLHSIRIRHGRHFVIGEELIDAFSEIRDEFDTPDICLLGVPDKGVRQFPEGFINLKTAIAPASKENLSETRDIRAKEQLAYIFTSGTTGMPKAAIQTHKKWLRCMQWFGRINLALGPDDVLYAPLPFFHANAFLIAWPAVLTNGSALVMRRKFSVNEFWSDIRKYEATAFIYIGEICRYLLNAPASPGDRDHKVKKIIGNGLRPEIWNEFRKRFGISDIYEFYGASDSNIIFTNTFNVDRSVGWSPVEFALVRYDIDKDEAVRNKKGRCERVDKGEAGLMLSRITKRFPFDGYVNASGNEEKVLRDVFRKGDEWFNTGDLMKNLGFGHTQFVDRVGDTFRWKGENVATAEVEQIINALNFVTACAVYGVNVPGCDGRAGMAAVKMTVEGGLAEVAVLASEVCRNLPSYARPVFLRIADDLEFTHTHKVIKSALKREGFDPGKVKDALFVMLPGEGAYSTLTEDVYRSICEGKYAF